MEKRFLILILLVFVPEASARKHILPGHLVPRFEFFQNCKENSSSMDIRSVELIDLGAKVGVGINADFFFRRPAVPTIAKSIINIKNCEDATSATCQHFQTWRFYGDSCDAWGRKNSFWASFCDRSSPALRCPFKAQKYAVRNGTIDMNLVEKFPFPLDKYHWRAQVETYDASLFTCVNFGIYFIRVRG